MSPSAVSEGRRAADLAVFGAVRVRERDDATALFVDAPGTGKGISRTPPTSSPSPLPPRSVAVVHTSTRASVPLQPVVSASLHSPLLLASARTRSAARMWSPLRSPSAFPAGRPSVQKLNFRSDSEKAPASPLKPPRPDPNTTRTLAQWSATTPREPARRGFDPPRARCLFPVFPRHSTRAHTSVALVATPAPPARHVVPPVHDPTGQWLCLLCAQ